ncbi:hypothetical protein [Vampirovibrio sp.]|uniref:hypothetical protein n=1 Tax=Vampirovibrio sp. TaxID=2717857 RepID=UPI003593F7A2
MLISPKWVGSSLTVALLSLSLFAALPANAVNDVHDGRVVTSGNFSNTANGKTTFINSGSGGLWVRENGTIRGIEVNAAGTPTNNGGTLHFYAPNSVVRIDGRINVNALQNNQGAYLGQGGKVFVDAAYYYQSGHIFANGFSGGLVQLNVGSATIQPGASIQAKGFGGAGGVISIQSDGVVQLKPNTLLDSSGKVAGTFDGNLINIEAGAVRAAGAMRANGVVTNVQEGSRGGTIRLIATGNTNLNQVRQALQDATTPGTQTGQLIPTFSNSERNTLNSELQDTVNRLDGDIQISGTFNPQNQSQVFPALLSANGSAGAVAASNDTLQENTLRAGDGGTIILSAMRNVQNLGIVEANGGNGVSQGNPVRGGNGGTLVATAGDRIANDLFSYTTRNNGLLGQFQANGGSGGSASDTQYGGAVGGKGGLLAFSHKTGMANLGEIIAQGGSGGLGSQAGGSFRTSGGSGGQGGLLVISGPSNPTGGGLLQVNGGNGGQGNNPLSVQAIGGVAGVIATPNPVSLAQSQRVSQKFGNAGLNQNNSRGTGGNRPTSFLTAENELLSNAENLILLSRTIQGGQNFTRLNDRAESATVRSVLNPLNANLAADQIIVKDTTGSNRPYRNFIIGSNANQLGLTLVKEPAFFLKDAYEINLNNLNTLTVLTDGALTNTHEWGTGSFQNMGGGRLSLLSGGALQNGTGLVTQGRISGGSINLASRSAIENFDLLSVQGANDDSNIHGGSIQLNARGDLSNFGFRLIGVNGRLIGGTQRLNTNGNLLNLGDFQAVAHNDQPNLAATGGNIQLRAVGNVQNGNEAFSPVFVFATALSGNRGYGGNIRMHGQSVNNQNGDINVNGSLKNGVVTNSP